MQCSLWLWSIDSNILKAMSRHKKLILKGLWKVQRLTSCHQLFEIFAQLKKRRGRKGSVHATAGMRERRCGCMSKEMAAAHLLEMSLRSSRLGSLALHERTGTFPRRRCFHWKVGLNRWRQGAMQAELPFWFIVNLILHGCLLFTAYLFVKGFERSSGSEDRLNPVE